MTRALRPYRWFGRDAPPAWEAVPAVTCAPPEPGPDPGAPPASADPEAWWAWLGAHDRANPGQRSALWRLQELEELRRALEQGLGASLSLDVFLGHWARDLRVLDATPPGQRPEGVSWLSHAVVALSDADPSALKALGAPEPLAPAALELVAGGALVVATRAAGWAVLPRPAAYYGEAAAPLGAPAEVVEALGLALGRGSRLERVLPAVIERLPAQVAWRADFWLGLLEHLDPFTLGHAAGDDERLWQAVAGTPAAGPLLATRGELALGSGDLSPAEALAAPSRAVRCLLEARGIRDVETARLWVEARDPATGTLDPARSASVLEPLRDALLADEPPRVAALLLRAHVVGGSEGVAALLDVLMAEGASTPSELRTTFRGMGPDRSGVAAAVAGTVYAGWMGVEEAGGRW